MRELLFHLLCDCVEYRGKWSAGCNHLEHFLLSGQRGLEVLAVGNVPDEARKRGFAIKIHPTESELYGKFLTVPVQAAHLDGAPVQRPDPGAQVTREARPMRRLKIRGLQNFDALANEIAGLMTEDVPNRGIGVLNQALLVQ